VTLVPTTPLATNLAPTERFVMPLTPVTIWPNSTMRTSWPTCCATSPTNLLGSGKTSAQQVVQLVGRWSCQSPTSRHSQCPASWPTSWLSGVYQPTSCTTSSCLVHQTRTCWPTSWQLVGQLVRIVEFVVTSSSPRYVLNVVKSIKGLRLSTLVKVSAIVILSFLFVYRIRTPLTPGARRPYFIHRKTQFCPFWGIFCNVSMDGSNTQNTLAWVESPRLSCFLYTHKQLIGTPGTSKFFFQEAALA
jgi:hypothetical protein